MPPINDLLVKQFAEFNSNLQVALQPIREIATAAQSIESFRDIALAISETLKKLPDDIRVVIQYLIEHGWYISAEMDIPFLRSLQRAVDTNNLATIDKLMGDWVTSFMPEIEARASLAFPNRAKIIAAAMKAHLCQEFELSVPVFLIQIDGMCEQKFNQKFYPIGDGGWPNTKKLAEMLGYDDPFASAFLLPLTQKSGLTANVQYRKSYPYALNRHEIIHGGCTDYASLINGLKAISLMDYFVSLVATREISLMKNEACRLKLS